MKTYTISKKKRTEKNSNAFFSLNTRFFGPENGDKSISINPVDLIISFPWPRITPQSEFSLKSYDRLKLRCSYFSFYFFSLFSFLSSLSSLFLYMKTDEKGLVIRGISVFKFSILECWIAINER
jgi:hypothetical protein